MKRAIREHATDFVAIIAVLVLALATVMVILIQQRADFPEWVPGVGEDRFELRAEIGTAQAVTPGQGQSVNIAGIRVGSISGVDVEQGNAVISMEIENEYAPLIREDATFLLRPRTGLQDMTLEMDVGSPDSPAMEEGATVPTSQTAPNVNPDEVLASLDADTRGFLRLLLGDGARALGGRGKQLSAVFRRFEPTTRDIAKFQGALASRRESLRQVIHNFGLLLEELGRRDDQLKRFVTSSNAVFDSFASQEEAIRASLRELPPTLSETRATLASAKEFGDVAGPASRDLIPAAQALAPALRQVRPLFRDTLDPIRDQIRPSTRRLGETTRLLDDAASGLAGATPALATGFRDLNILFNEFTYNPPGAQEEGFLFWASWLSHNVNALSTLRDANGPLLRGIVMITCGNTTLAAQVASQRPFLRVLYDATLTPTRDEICPPSNLPFRERDQDAAPPPAEPEQEEAPDKPEPNQPTPDPTEPDTGGQLPPSSSVPDESPLPEDSVSGAAQESATQPEVGP